MDIDSKKNTHKIITFRLSESELDMLDSKAFLVGLTRSEFIRSLLNQKWDARYRKFYHPFVPICGLLLLVSSQLSRIFSGRTDVSENETLILDSKKEIEMAIRLLYDEMETIKKDRLSFKRDELDDSVLEENF